MDGLTTTVTSFIDEEAATGSDYPRGFFTMPHLEQHFGTARNASGAFIVAYIPTVQSDDLELWAEYSDANQDWIAKYNLFLDDDSASVVDPILPQIWDYPDDDETHLFLQECNNEESVKQREQTSFEEDHSFRTPLESKDGPFAPLWTFSPAPNPGDTSIINHDLFGREEFEKAVASVDLTQKPLFIHVCNLYSWFDNQDHSDEEQAVIAYPVFGGFETNSSIVGHIVEVVPWRYFFEEILPAETLPLHVVLENTCGDATTFAIEGREARVLEKRDVHDTQYDNLALETTFAEFANSPDVVTSDLEEICIYTMTVYPTEEFADEFKTARPAVYAVVVLSVFLLTCVLFVTFDVLITRHRNAVMDTAKKQNAIVSSLFPKSIQAKMMDQINSDNNKLSKVGKAGLRNYLFDTDVEGDARNQTEKSLGPHNKSKPIADLFPETTIMFGDIAG